MPRASPYAQTRKWMLGATAKSWSILPDRVHCVAFQRPDGGHSYAVWRTPAHSAPQNPVLPREGMVPEAAMVAEDAVKPTPFTIPASWHIATAHDLDGGVNDLASNQILVTDSPILLQDAARN